MIWGKTTYLSENIDAFERAKISLRNDALCLWHPFFTLKRVHLIDGRKAVFSRVERKFHVDADLTRYEQDIEHGYTDIASTKKKDLFSLGCYIYREKGSIDDLPEKEEVEETTAEEWYRITHATVMEEDPPQNGRREAIAAQKARKGEAT